MPRVLYHDSFEYYGVNCSDELLSAFEKLNGYKLQDNYDVFTFSGKEDDIEADRVLRIKADYRRTLAAMHLHFTERWIDWTHRYGIQVRNKAHGGPVDLLDVYAVNDIPETKFFRNDKNPLVAKLASSAAHVVGRKLASNESCRE